MKHCIQLFRGFALLVLGTMAVPVLAEPPPPADTHETRSGTGVWRVGAPSDSDCHFSDIQDAIDATFSNDGGFSTINVRVSGSEDIHIGNTYEIDAENFDNVTTFRVIGGHDDCDSSPISGEQTVLNAGGNGRVFDLLYEVGDSAALRTIVLRNLEITGGVVSGAGGGVRVHGHSGRHRVRFSNVNVNNNNTLGSGSGGGISIEATSGDDSSINWISTTGDFSVLSNDAVGAGGGIACFNVTGDTNPPLSFFEPTILGNSADSNGGGISIHGCDNFAVTTASTGVFFERAIALNEAGAGSGTGKGGGIRVAHGGHAQVRATSGRDDPAALIAANTADYGGGVSVDGEDSYLHLGTTRINGNFARENGGGVFVGENAELLMDRENSFGGIQGDCLNPASNPKCSRIDGNHANGDGGAVRLTGTVNNSATAVFNQTIIDNNSADGLGSVGSLSEWAALAMEGAAIHGNHGSSRLFQVTGGSGVILNWSTIAGNDDPDVPVQVFRLLGDVGIQASVQVSGSIIWEPGATMVNATSETSASAQCVIGHVDESDGDFDFTAFYSNIDPELVDPKDGDIRLGRHSPAIDYCDDSDVSAFDVPEYNDMFNNSREVDYNVETTDAPNPGNGLFDLGAHERQQVIDEIFKDRFEE